MVGSTCAPGFAESYRCTQVARQAAKSKGFPYSIGVRWLSASPRRAPASISVAPAPHPSRSRWPDYGPRRPRIGGGSMTRINTRTQLAAVCPPTAAVSREAGHKPQSPLHAIREKCRDCSCYQLNEIRACEAVKCASWPSGRHPSRAEARKTPLTDAAAGAQP